MTQPDWFLKLSEGDRADILARLPLECHEHESRLANTWAWLRQQRALDGPPVARRDIAAKGIRVDIFPIPLDVFYVKHRTAQERSGSGHMPPDLPWEVEGPFTREVAEARWAEIHPNWQEGGVVTKCVCCGQYAPVVP